MEIHVTGADTFAQVFQAVKYKMIMGLTGTFDRLDGKQALIAQYCPVVDSISINEATKNGWLAEYREYKVMLDVDLTEYEIANREFIKHFATFDFDFNLAMECVTGKKVANRVVKASHLVRYELAQQRCLLPHGHPGRIAMVKQINKDLTASTFAWSRAMKARKAFVMSHPRKVEVAKQILEARKESKAITFSATIKDAEKIGVGYVLHSGQTKKKRGLTAEAFNALDCGVLNTSKALDVGADIQGLNLGIILSNQSSSIQKKQRLGRTNRKEGDKTSEVFTLVLKGTMEEQWFNKSTSGLEYTTINEDELERVLDGEVLNTRQREDYINEFEL